MLWDVAAIKKKFAVTYKPQWVTCYGSVPVLTVMLRDAVGFLFFHRYRELRLKHSLWEKEAATVLLNFQIKLGHLSH